MAAAAPTLEKQAVTEFDPIVLHFKPILKRLSDDEFLEFCNLNEEWRFEVNRKGDLEILFPAGFEIGRRNAWLIMTLGNWAEEDCTGVYFGSDLMVKLPNGARRSPGVSWVKLEKWLAISQKELKKTPVLCPDFVVEWRSQSDHLNHLKKKMQEYMENGAQLGWLIDPRNRKVYVYRPGVPVEELNETATLSGEPLLRGFVMPTDRLW